MASTKRLRNLKRPQVFCSIRRVFFSCGLAKKHLDHLGVVASSARVISLSAGAILWEGWGVSLSKLEPPGMIFGESLRPQFFFGKKIFLEVKN